MRTGTYSCSRHFSPSSAWRNADGTVAIEAAIAFPILMMIIFSFIAVVQLLSVRSLVYDQVVQESRRRGVSELQCGDESVVTDAAEESKTRILDGLLAKGIQMDPNDIQITANNPLPQDVTNWNISAQFQSQCTVCEILQGIVPLRGFFQVNMSIYRDGKGCF